MTGYEQFLTIVLASFLGIFLVLAIALTVLLIKITKTIKRITDKAESFADKAEAVGEFFENASGPMALGRALATISESFFKRYKSHKSKGKD